jgi:small subunit ribosomal protein S6
MTYETAIVFDPELPEDRRKEFLAKLSGVIASFRGRIVKQDDWGVRKLAYPIRKRSNGYYTFLVYSGDRGVVEELERNIRIFDGILRYLTSGVEVEVEAEAAAPAEEEAAPAAPEAPEEAGSAAPEEQAPPA